MSTTVPDPTGLSDRVVSVLRTAVPAWWGSLVAWVLAATSAHLPAGVQDALAGLLGSEVARGLAVAVVIACWYALWRWAEPRVPAWLVRLALGSARTPAYSPSVAGMSVTDRDNLALLAAALDENDPGRAALQRAGVQPYTRPVA